MNLKSSVFRLACLLAGLLAGCAGGGNSGSESTSATATAAEPDTISYTLRTDSVRLGDCSNRKPCRDIVLTKLFLNRVPGGAAVKENILKAYYQAMGDTSLEKLRADFQKELQEMGDMSDFPGALEWYERLEAGILRNDSLLFTVSVDYNSYEGGAHGMYGLTFLNFESKTGKLLTWNDLFSTSDLQGPVLQLAEANFRKQKGIAPGQTYADAGYLIDTFKLAENFFIAPDTLIMLYNPYEAAPYAYGPVQVNLPLDQLMPFSRHPAIVPRDRRRAQVQAH